MQSWLFSMRSKALFSFLSSEGIIILMSTEGKLVISSISGIITGILVSTGHLSANNANAFQSDLETVGGILISLLSLAYLLEHLLLKLKSEINTPVNATTKIVSETTTTVPSTSTTEVTT